MHARLFGVLSDDVALEARRVIKRQPTMLTSRLFEGTTVFALDMRGQVPPGGVSAAAL